MNAPIIVRVTTSAVQVSSLGRQTTDTSIRAAVSRALLQREDPTDVRALAVALDTDTDESWGDLEDDLEILSRVGGVS